MPGPVRPGDEMVFLCNPNNPTGSLAEPGRWRLRWRPVAGWEQFWWWTSASCPLRTGLPARDCCREYPNLIVLRAFTKLYAMAGLRLGYLLCSGGDLAGRIAAWGQCWSVSTPPRWRGWRPLSLPDWEERTRRYLRTERPRWQAGSGRWAFRCTLQTAASCCSGGRRPSGTRPWSGA